MHNEPISSGESRSAWMRATGRPEYPPLDHDAQADVCVVGAGISGLTAAYLLAKAGRSVIVLDDGPVVSGESERTTAHIVNVLDDRYLDIEKYHGEVGARLAAESHTAAMDRIERIVRDEKIDCGFTRLPGYLFLSPGEPESLLRDELAALHRAGIADARLRKDSPLAFCDLGPCIEFPGQAQFHPLLYLFQLCRSIERLGGRICTFTRVTSVEPGPPCVVVTESGRSVTAGAAIIATNAPVSDNALIYSKQAPYRTFVIASPVPRDSVPQALYWDTGPYTKEGGGAPYHYVRLQRDGDGDLLIVGGEDHKTGQYDDAPLRFSNLKRWTKTHFPMAGEPRYSWSGQVMEPFDGMGLIGRKPGQKGEVFIISGDSGNGMTHGTIGGMLLADLIAGKNNPWTDLYDPGRVRLKAAGEFVRENAGVAKDLAEGWLSPGDRREEDVAKGSGAVIRKGVTKIALYIDDDGRHHAFSAVCPHKGCIVGWNSLEKSFDCPCHGSRYDRYGKLLTGPSPCGLKPVDAQA